MKERIHHFSEKIFAVSLLIALIGGGIVALLFTLSLMIGGNVGEGLAVVTKSKILPWFIRLASIGILFGLIQTYTTGQHSLSMRSDRAKPKNNKN